ncbi:class I adenylate-forming enzyme family protein [Ilumatobacter sp.]|uniref:class I adenylate-forming enzyme family protein n=1 Tax=Ilumatobacter sp. TaxID=1967498 RepID=UPI0037500E5B
MAGRLVALDLPGGPDFIDELQRIWANGDAAFPVDQRFPAPAKQQICAAMRVGDDIEPGDALVVATSGSTGTPKGVVLTHDAVAASAEATSIRLGVGAGDHWLACLPLSHVGGLSVVTRALHAGTALTVLPAFDAAAVDASDANLVSLVATALARIDSTNFRTIVLGGARPPANRPANAVTTYGLTETGSGVVYDGIPLDGVDVDIGDDHEIRLRGPMLTRGYRNGQSPITDDGWLPTGDLGGWTDRGQLHVDGRKGDLIISGGENIWPEAVELLVTSHPDVAEVMARGVDDTEWGQIVEVVVVPLAGRTPDLESIRSHVKQNAPSYLAPKRLILVESLPRTALGKLRRIV